MMTRPFIAEIAALIGDPARANMLLALMAGRALTAGELAYAAQVAPQTASAHLGKLAGARLLALEKQGRHRYFRLASPEVAEMLEGLMAVAVDGAPRYRPPSRATKRCAKRGLATTTSRVVSVWRSPTPFSLEGISCWMTTAGKSPLTALGFSASSVLTSPVRQSTASILPAMPRLERAAATPWGAIGAAVAARCFELGWINRVKASRAVAITSSGRRGFFEIFGMPISDDWETTPAEG